MRNYWELINQAAWIEKPNHRRNGMSGVKIILQDGVTLFCKYQKNHFYRSFTSPLKKLTIIREQKANTALKQIGLLVPNVVFCEVRNNDKDVLGLLVMEKLDGFVNLDDWYKKHDQEQDDIMRYDVLDQIAKSLSLMHKHRWQHGCLYNKHIFIKDSMDQKAEVALIDLEKARKRLSAKKVAQSDLSQFKRHKGLMPEKDWNYFLKQYRKYF